MSLRRPLDDASFGQILHLRQEEAQDVFVVRDEDPDGEIERDLRDPASIPDLVDLEDRRQKDIDIVLGQGAASGPHSRLGILDHAIEATDAAGADQEDPVGVRLEIHGVAHQEGIDPVLKGEQCLEVEGFVQDLVVRPGGIGPVAQGHREVVHAHDAVEVLEPRQVGGQGPVVHPAGAGAAAVVFRADEGVDEFLVLAEQGGKLLHRHPGSWNPISQWVPTP